MEHLLEWNYFSNNYNTKIVHYTQTFIDDEKVYDILNKLTLKWIINNPVAFEVFNDKLYITEGHHRLESAIKLGNKEIISMLFQCALYYDVKHEPEYFKKRKIKLN